MRKLVLKLVVVISILSNCFSGAFGQTFPWNSVSIGGGGFVSAIIMSKTQANVMYARTDVGGAYRWDAANSQWIPLNDWVSENETGYLGIESIAIDPQANNKVYMLAGIEYFNSGKTAILRSSDNGNTFAVTEVTSQFTAHGNGMGRQTGEKLQVDPNNGNTLYCGTRKNGLFRSTDAGVSWNRLTSLNVTTTPNGNGISFVVLDKNSATSGNNSQKIFVGVCQTGTNFYMSTNGGTSFAAVANAPTGLMPQRAVLASDGNMYITYANGAGPHPANGETMDAGQVWKYNSGTGAWTNITPSGFTRAMGGISVDPNNPSRIIASSCNTYVKQYDYTNASGTTLTAYGDRFFLSTNGGSSWRDLVGNAIVLNANGSSWIREHSIHWAGCIEFNPFNTNQAWVTSGNGVFTCDNVNDTQTTWKFNVKGLEETVPLDIVSITGGPLLSVIGDYDGFRHTDVTQFPPIHTPRTGTTTGIAYGGVNTNKVLRVGNNMYYSNNMGVSWTQCSLNGVKGRVAVSADGNTFLHCPENSSITYRSTNNGGSWTACTGISVNNAMPVADPVNSNKFYAYNNGTMLVSTNGGASFSASGTLPSGGSKIIRTVPGMEGHLWVAAYNGGLYRSTNSGSSFTKINSVTACGAVGLGKAATGTNYHALYIWGTVGGVRGVFRSTDQGATWLRINDDAHEYGGPGNGQFVIGDMNVYGRVYMSTAGRGIAYGESGSSCTPTAITPSMQVNGGAWQQVSTATINAGDQVVLGPQPSSGGTWSWTGCGTTGASREQTISPSANCTATATYTNTCGAQSTQAFTFTVNTNTPPTISITSPANNTTFTAPASITINATATDANGTVTNVEFYNGTTLIGSDASSPYSFVWNNVAAGTYTITAKSTDNAGATTTSAAITVTVNACTSTAIIPYLQVNGGAWLQASAATVNVGDQIVFGPQPNVGGTWSWTGCGTTGSSREQTIGPASTCSSTATYTNTCGAQSTQTFSITVNTPPTINISAPTNNSSSCAGSTITLTASASDAGGSISKVEFFDGAALLTTLTVAPYTYQWTNAGQGTHSITAKATDNGNATSTSSVVNITVNAIPSAPGVTTPVVYCQNATAVALTANGTGLKWYTAPSSGTPTTNAPVPTTSNAGTVSHYVSQTVNGCESGRSSISVQVNATPAAPGVTTPVSYCQNATSVPLTASGSELKWYAGSSGGSGSSSAPTPVTTAAGTTNHYVSQTINGCESSRAGIVVNVYAYPEAKISTAGPTTICEGSSVTLNANIGAGYSYDWRIGGPTVGSNLSYNATSSGSYTVIVSSNGCSTTSLPVSVTVQSNVIATAGPDQTINSTSTALAANLPSSTQGEWMVVSGSGTFADPQNPATIVSGLSPGENIFKWTLSNSSCPPTSDEVIITVTSTTALFSSSASSSNVNAYPNPFTEEISITFKDASSIKLTIRVVDMSGSVIFESENFKTNQEVMLGKELTQGMYMVVAVGDNGMVKVVKVEKQ